MADAGAPPAPEAAMTPISAGGGKYIEILDLGLRITTRMGCFKSPLVQTTSWDDFRRCDVETHCFTGTITLAQADGDSITLRVSMWKLPEIARAIYTNINAGKHGEVKPEITEMLGNRPRAMVFGSGLVIARSHSLCRKATTFVPWEAVVSLSLRSGCFASHILVKTLLEVHNETEEAKAGQRKSSVGSVDSQGQGAQRQPAHVQVDLRGKASDMEPLFAELLELMNNGAAPETLPEGDQVPGTTLTTLGLRTTSWGVQQMLPWSSIAAVDLQISCLRQKLVLTDLVGTEVKLGKVAPGEFDAVRAQIARAKGASVASNDAASKPIIRRNISLTRDGISVTTRHFCSGHTRFISWQKVDAIEMKVSCFHGSLVLITEAGERIQACRASLFGMRAMNELANRIQDMKFGKSGHECTRAFAGREGDRRASVLTKSSVRLVTSKGCCSRVIRIVDLDSVNTCEAAGPRKLLVSMRESMGIDGDEEKEGVQPVEVRLGRGDDAADIAADMMRRAHARKQSQ